MSEISVDIDVLVAPVPGERPGGVDLEPEVWALQQRIRAPQAAMVGDAQDERDWPTLRDDSIGLLHRSKDIRGAICLTRALAQLYGWPGVSVGLSTLSALIEQLWDDLYPPADPEEPDDPYSERLGALYQLVEPELIEELRRAKLIGAVSFSQAVADPQKPELMLAFSQMPEEDRARVAGLADVVSQIRNGVQTRLGNGEVFDLGELEGICGDASRVVRSLAGEPAAADATHAGNGSVQGAAPTVAAAPGEVRSREDVLMALDRICEYYAKHEPSSPVPLLMQRAKRLVHMSFVDIIEDMAKKGLEQVQLIVGKDDA